MGITEATVRLVNPASPDRSIEVDMTVDSGAIFSVVPADLLKRIGIVPRACETFQLANAHSVRRDVGDALGLRLDPLRRQLRPLKLMIA